MIKKIREDLNKWRSKTHLWIGRCNTANMPILPRLIYGFNKIPTKPQKALQVHVDELILKFTRKGKGVTMWGEGLTTKGQHKGILVGDGAVLYHSVVTET